MHAGSIFTRQSSPLPPTSTGAQQCSPCPVHVPSLTLCPLGHLMQRAAVPALSLLPLQPMESVYPQHLALLLPGAPPAPRPPPPQQAEGLPSPFPSPQLTGALLAAAASTAALAPCQRVPGAQSPLLGQRLSQVPRSGPPLGSGPATCPGERLARRQRGRGWRAGWKWCLVLTTSLLEEQLCWGELQPRGVGGTWWGSAGGGPSAPRGACEPTGPGVRAAAGI